MYLSSFLQNQQIRLDRPGYIKRLINIEHVEIISIHSFQFLSMKILQSNKQNRS